jgi:hypothetical protein
VNVLVTLAVLAVLAMWGLAVYNRLVRLRSQIKTAWKQLDAGRKEGDAAGARQTYNDVVVKYNDALQTFPANIVAGLVGFHAANKFESQ